MTYDYIRKGDLKELAAIIRNLPDGKAVMLTAFVMDRRLMLPRGLAAKALWISIRLGAWIKDRTPYEHAVRVFLLRPEGLTVARDTANQTADWLLDGKDASDPRSAGGFNELELTMIVEFLRRYDLLVARS